MIFTDCQPEGEERPDALMKKVNNLPRSHGIASMTGVLMRTMNSIIHDCGPKLTQTQSLMKDNNKNQTIFEMQEDRRGKQSLEISYHAMIVC